MWGDFGSLHARIGKRGHSLDYFYALEVDVTQGGMLFHSPKGFLNWILMLFLFGVKNLNRLKTSIYNICARLLNFSINF